MPSIAERWRIQAAEALAAAASMNDPQMGRVMVQISLGYRQMAEHAQRREMGETRRPAPGVSFGPEALTAICKAFDQAWHVIAPTAGDDPREIDVARAGLAAAMLSVANEDSRDASVLRDAALQMLALGYRL